MENIEAEKKDQSTMLSNPRETTVKCKTLVSWMLTRAFVTAGVRDATAGIHNIRDRVRGATHLRRNMRAENWDIMAVGMKGEVGVGCESEEPYREAVARQVIITLRKPRVLDPLRPEIY